MPLRDAIPFWKMSGSGNDFVVIDNREGVLPQTDSAAFTRAVCRHRVSVGADGVVLIESSDEPGIDFRWRYINADGTDGEMCGNGAMCGARFAYLNGIAPAGCRFRTESGIVHARVSSDPGSARVAIAIADPGALHRDLIVHIEDKEIALDAVQVGVPHAVVIVDDVDTFAPGVDLNRIGRAIRIHPRFAPAGTNVNVVARRGDHVLRMRTYERGVEDETLACGTGAVASAIVATERGLVRPPVEVVTTSGRSLFVNFDQTDQGVTKVTLEGEARIIARGTIDPEALM